MLNLRKMLRSSFAKRVRWSLQMLFVLSVAISASQQRGYAQTTHPSAAAKKGTSPAKAEQKPPVASGSNAAERSAAASENPPTKEGAAETPALTHASNEAAGVKEHSAKDESAAEKSKENAEGGDDDAFKYSPSVRWFADKTGMDVHTGYWVFTILNFVVVIGLIVWAMKAAWPKMVRARNEQISKALDEARRTSEEARRRLGDIESRLSKLDGEIAAMRSQAESEARAEEEKMKQAAAEEGQRILSAAEQEIASASANARRDLKAFAAEMAVDLAKRRIVAGGALDGDSDKRLVREFSERLSANGKEGSA